MTAPRATLATTSTRARFQRSRKTPVNGPSREYGQQQQREGGGDLAGGGLALRGEQHEGARAPPGAGRRRPGRSAGWPAGAASWAWPARASARRARAGARSGAGTARAAGAGCTGSRGSAPGPMLRSMPAPGHPPSTGALGAAHGQGADRILAGETGAWTDGPRRCGQRCSAGTVQPWRGCSTPRSRPRAAGCLALLARRDLGLRRRRRDRLTSALASATARRAPGS